MSGLLRRARIGLIVVLALAGGIWMGFRVANSWHKRQKAPVEADEGNTRMAAVIKQKQQDIPPKPPAGIPRAEASSLPIHSEPMPQEEPPPVPVTGTVKGKLVDMAGNPVTIEMVVFSPEGRFNINVLNGQFESAVPPGTLRLIGQFRDGLRLSQTAPIQVEVEAGKIVEATLVVPISPPVGTLGFRYIPDADFLEITSVDQGSSAFEAGMAPGDAIIEVDGVAVRDMDPAVLGEYFHGPPGTMVSVIVVAETTEGLREFSLRLERRVPAP